MFFSPYAYTFYFTAFSAYSIANFLSFTYKSFNILESTSVRMFPNSVFDSEPGILIFFLNT